MDDRILTYYNRELTYIRKMGAEFSQQHPKIAGRLRLDQDTIEDPHVSRLIESFAFLTARIRQTLDDSFPELTESLIGILYPNYHAPFPSLSILKFNAIPQVPEYQLVEKGREFTVENEDNQSCRFKLCYDVHVLPITLSEVKFSPLPIIGPPLTNEISLGKQTKSVLKIKIAPLIDAKLEDIDQDRIRFYISATDQIASTLINYLSTAFIGGCVTSGSNSDKQIDLNLKDLEFPEINLLKAGDLPIDGRNSTAQEEITNYFVFPQKFLFFEIKNLNQAWQTSEDGFCIYLHFNHDNAELSQGLDTLSLQTNCAPIINLYRDSTDPKEVNHGLGDQKLVVNKIYQDVADVHSIVKVFARNDQGDEFTITPFYGEHKRSSDDERHVYWSLRRENSSVFNGLNCDGTDSYLSLVDHNFNTFSPRERWLLSTEVLCTNRDLPSKLPFGPNNPQFSFIEGGAGIRLKCLVPPTKTIQPKQSQASRWQLVNQLTLQSFSGTDGLATLKATLSLLDLKASRESQAAIDSIQSIVITPTTERVHIGGRATICTGSQCTLTINEKAFTGSSVYLFGKVMHGFLSHLCVMNSFVKTALITGSSNEPSYLWPATLGETDLL